MDIASTQLVVTDAHVLMVMKKSEKLEHAKVSSYVLRLSIFSFKLYFFSNAKTIPYYKFRLSLSSFARSHKSFCGEFC